MDKLEALMKNQMGCFQDHMERHKHEFIIIRSICIVRFMSDKYFNQIGSPEIKTGI